jgi:hypothetical protein
MTVSEDPNRHFVTMNGGLCHRIVELQALSIAILANLGKGAIEEDLKNLRNYQLSFESQRFENGEELVNH